ncbi:hypothetical protein [Lysinibacillus fusiformis]|uniref:hypothetical protein n=1 Tax=Lysinibacillus fusiformis TaxID=28031 RepID=UPI0011A80E3F|nr:hypothetical protein [Lysinibacillus fusiformis]
MDMEIYYAFIIISCVLMLSILISLRTRRVLNIEKRGPLEKSVFPMVPLKSKQFESVKVQDIMNKVNVQTLVFINSQCSACKATLAKFQFLIPVKKEEYIFIAMDTIENRDNLSYLEDEYIYFIEEEILSDQLKIDIFPMFLVLNSNNFVVEKKGIASLENLLGVNDYESE